MILLCAMLSRITDLASFKATDLTVLAYLVRINCLLLYKKEIAFFWITNLIVISHASFGANQFLN